MTLRLIVCFKTPHFLKCPCQCFLSCYCVHLSILVSPQCILVSANQINDSRRKSRLWDLVTRSTKNTCHQINANGGTVTIESALLEKFRWITWQIYWIKSRSYWVWRESRTRETCVPNTAQIGPWPFEIPFASNAYMQTDTRQTIVTIWTSARPVF